MVQYLDGTNKNLPKDQKQLNSEEQDISPQTSNQGSSTKKRRQRKRKVDQNATKDDSDPGSPTIDL